MLWLLLRVLVPACLVFGVAYGITRAWRTSAHSAAVRRIQEEIRTLKVGLEAGIYSDAEYRERRDRVATLCARQGIAVPELPAHIRSHDDDLES